ncbi:ribonuclease P protein component [Acinetobacter qingfengensis]|uniref:Ribonuclease P protein component n=1 Tax=Acinetobacter qingfengensis TaxID=1262585 RepID=A0A1E7QWZ5_9GAMM|nr:ribonuclease P protein component [Acinetobacter qingfengensis]KAA8731237.1 ribonuclease P protein component [Acinetobacter qingfengensis]OEY91516.1 ribonuclease P protein component [Acinetobacter qingfengensis]
MALYSFGKDVRLRCAKDYQGVFTHTLFKVHQPHFLILASLATDMQSHRIGVVVAKKKVRRAHERNRIKRISRESFRLNQHQLSGFDIVVMPKIGIEKISNAELHQQLDMTWTKLKRLLTKYKLQQNKVLSTN